MQFPSLNNDADMWLQTSLFMTNCKLEYRISSIKPTARPSLSKSLNGTRTCKIPLLIIHMKILLDSDWLREVQFKCNNSAKSVTPVQITHCNSGLWFAQRQWEFFLGQWYHVKQWQKVCMETLKKLSPMRKKWLQETSSRNFSARTFSCLYY